MKWFAVVVVCLWAQLAEAGVNRDGSETSDPVSAQKKEENSNRAKINKAMKGEANREKLAKTDVTFVDTERTEVEKENNDRELSEHSYEELDYNVYEPLNDLNHVITIEEHNNVLEETDEYERKKKHSLLKRSVCKPSEVFQAECNSCKCAPDGQSYTCSHNECMEGEFEKNEEVEVFRKTEGVDHIEHHMVCAARGTFYIGCNTCHCNALGTDYSCTNKPCPLPEDVELFHELRTETKASSNNQSTKQVCVANRMFIKDCNTCWCNEDGTRFFCTRKVCVPELPEEGVDNRPENMRLIERECRPNEVFEMECNMCRCNPDGKSFSCTRRACVDAAGTGPVVETVKPDDKAENASQGGIGRGRKRREALKVCQSNQEFRMDCNICLCDKLGETFSCTRKDCNESQGAVSRTRRETIPDDASERKKTEPEVINTSTEPGTDPNFRCNPGEQMKRACNDCQCSADGKSVFCTVKLCDQDITPPRS